MCFSLFRLLVQDRRTPSPYKAHHPLSDVRLLDSPLLPSLSVNRIIWGRTTRPQDTAGILSCLVLVLDLGYVWAGDGWHSGPGPGALVSTADLRSRANLPPSFVSLGRRWGLLSSWLSLSLALWPIELHWHFVLQARWSLCPTQQVCGNLVALHCNPRSWKRLRSDHQHLLPDHWTSSIWLWWGGRISTLSFWGRINLS